MALTERMRPLLILLLILFTVQYADSIKSCKLDVVFVIDNSGSIGGFKTGGMFIKDWELVKGFAMDIIKEMRISRTRTRVGLVDFGDLGYLEFDLNEYKEQADILKALARLDYKGELTNTTGGLKLARTLLTNPEFGSRDSDVPKLIILITDGDPTVDENTLDDEIYNLRWANIPVIAVGVTDKVRDEIMLKIATTKEDFFRVQTFSDLDSVKKFVVTDEICEKRVISTVSTIKTSATTSATTTESTTLTTPTMTSQSTVYTTETTTECLDTDQPRADSSESSESSESVESSESSEGTSSSNDESSDSNGSSENENEDYDSKKESSESSYEESRESDSSSDESRSGAKFRGSYRILNTAESSIENDESDSQTSDEEAYDNSNEYEEGFM